MTVTQKIALLRQEMKAHQMDAYLVLSADPHLSEYLPEHWATREWLTGFTGSVGNVLITEDFVGLWTDSRYWEQAEAQLQGTDIVLMKMGASGVPSIIEWIVAHVPADTTLGVDGKVLDIAFYQQLDCQLTSRGIKLNIVHDLFNAIYLDRPALPVASIYEFPQKFSTLTRMDKISQVRSSMQNFGVQAHLISSLDDIAYLLNIRGSDVEYNPVFLSFLLIKQDRIVLYVDPQKINTDIRALLEQDGVEIKDYRRFDSLIASDVAGATLLCDPARTTMGVLNLCDTDSVVYELNPSQRMKSVKSEMEMDYIRVAHDKDGAALCEFFAWFEEQMAKGASVSELDVDAKLLELRSKQENFISPSFGTIAGFNGNGAMPHYSATPESYAQIEGDGLLLIDSGAQFFEGTTDITRVCPVGKITDQHRYDFTQVLKSHIQLALAVFPDGIASPLLDMYARGALWKVGLDFGHGTGHGVGYCMNVHEGPQVISWTAYKRPNTEMHVGMITSNEPGLYRPGQWGIRIENLVLTVPAFKTEFGTFNRFDTVTMCPIDTRCIDKSLLTDEEITWLNSYHETVRERLSPRVSGAAKAWLIERTQAI